MRSIRIRQTGRATHAGFRDIKQRADVSRVDPDPGAIVRRLRLEQLHRVHRQLDDQRRLVQQLDNAPLHAALVHLGFHFAREEPRSGRRSGARDSLLHCRHFQTGRRQELFA